MDQSSPAFPALKSGVDQKCVRRLGVIAHGMWGGALISVVLGTRLPGAGTVYRAQPKNSTRRYASAMHSRLS